MVSLESLDAVEMNCLVEELEDTLEGLLGVGDQVDVEDDLLGELPGVVDEVELLYYYVQGHDVLGVRVSGDLEECLGVYLGLEDLDVVLELVQKYGVLVAFDVAEKLPDEPQVEVEWKTLIPFGFESPVQHFHIGGCFFRDLLVSAEVVGWQAWTLVHLDLGNLPELLEWMICLMENLTTQEDHQP